MPGNASLHAAMYYAHPRNRFWPLMQELLGIDAGLAYPARLLALAGCRVGLWDVIGQCERRGSLDTAIVASSIVVNPLAARLASLPQLRAVACNGAAAAQHGAAMCSRCCRSPCTRCRYGPCRPPARPMRHGRCHGCARPGSRCATRWINDVGSPRNQSTVEGISEPMAPCEPYACVVAELADTCHHCSAGRVGQGPATGRKSCQRPARASAAPGAGMLQPTHQRKRPDGDQARTTDGGGPAAGPAGRRTGC